MNNHSDIEAAPTTAEVLPSVKPEQPVVNPWTVTPQDKLILSIGGQILSFLGLIYLDIFCPDTSSLLLYLFQGACGSLLLIAYVVLSIANAENIISPKGPDIHPSGGARAAIGAMIGVTVAALIAALTHVLDDKSWIYQIFWIQFLALPSACLAGYSSILADMIGDEQDLIAEISIHIMSNLLLWFHLENRPGPLRPGIESGILWQWTAWLVATCFLFSCSVASFCFITCRIIENRLSDNSRAIILVIIGSLSGIFVMWLFIESLDILLHPTTLHKLLWTYLGALPGTYLIGTSSWLIRVLKSSPEYSIINPAEPSEL